jgi:hypothetical protein
MATRGDRLDLDRILENQPPELTEGFRHALALARSLPHLGPPDGYALRYALLSQVRLAAAAAMTSLLAAASAECDLDTPLAAIDMLPDAAGSLIYRCRHKSAHEWDLSGNRI